MGRRGVRPRPRDPLDNFQTHAVFERTARASCVKAGIQALNQIRSLVSTTPAELHEQPRSMTIKQVIATCSAHRPPQRLRCPDRHQGHAQGVGPAGAAP